MSDYRAMIEVAAYYRAERRGFLPGFETEDWLAAEREVCERLMSTVRPATPKKIRVRKRKATARPRAERSPLGKVVEATVAEIAKAATRSPAVSPS